MRCSTCSQDVRPIVAVDIDGTLAKYHEPFEQFCHKYWGRLNPRPEPYDGFGDFEKYLGLSREEYRQAKLAYRQSGAKRWAPMYHDAFNFTRSLKNLGVEVWAATTRPWQRLDNIDPDTREWLARNNVPIDGLLFGDDKYLQLVTAVDRERILMVVDDQISQILIAEEFGLPVWQVDREHNRHQAVRWPVRGSLADALAVIKERKEGWDAANSGR